MKEHTLRMDFLPDVKVLICYLLSKCGRKVTLPQLTLICSSVGVDYFMINDALADLIQTGAAEKDGEVITLNDAGIRSAAFADDVSRVFRRRVLKSALEYFRSCDGLCSGSPGCCEVRTEGKTLYFSLSDEKSSLIELTLTASEEQAGIIKENISADPVCAYNRIVSLLVSGKPCEGINADITEDDGDITVELSAEGFLLRLTAPDPIQAQSIASKAGRDIPGKLIDTLCAPPPPVDTDSLLG